jgi:hypothetical protein
MERVFNGCLPPLFRMVISGASSTGKSTLLGKILENRNGILEKNFTRIVYMRGVPTTNEVKWKEKFGTKLITLDGIPPENIVLPLLKNPDETTVLVIEDLDEQACSSPLISKIFTAYSHHLSFSVILSTQNIFRPGKERLTLIRNTTHLVLFPNNLDETVIRLVAQKVYIKDPKRIVTLFEQLTSKPYGYLSIWSNCEKELKFRSHLSEDKQHIYVLD